MVRLATSSVLQRLTQIYLSFLKAHNLWFIHYLFWADLSYRLRDREIRRGKGEEKKGEGREKGRREKGGGGEERKGEG